MAITETLSVTTSTTSLTTSVGATDRELVKLYHVVASPASISLINSALYTITGYSDTSQKLSIVFDDWTDYVGDSILVVIYTDIDTGNVADAMLTNFGTAANISPTTLQNEMAHVYYIIGQITGGAAVADVSLADLSDAITRINDLADDIFTTTTNSGSPALWDGTNTLSIGGDTNVQAILTTHESRVDAVETLLGFDTGGGLTSDVVASILAMQANLSAINDLAGIPNPYAPLLPSGTRLIFQQTSAPTGWTKDTTAAYNEALMVGTTGTVATGGAANATTWLSGHVHPIAHTHTVDCAHNHTVSPAWLCNISGAAGFDNIPYDASSLTTSQPTWNDAGTSTRPTSAASAANSTAPTTSPKHFTAIVASKD